MHKNCFSGDFSEASVIQLNQHKVGWRIEDYIIQAQAILICADVASIGFATIGVKPITLGPFKRAIESQLLAHPEAHGLCGDT